METGGSVLAEHYDAVNASSSVASLAAFFVLRETLPGLLPRGSALHWPTFEEAPVVVRAFAADLHAAGVIRTMPVGALVHHTVLLGWHQDRLAPPNSKNFTVVVRERCTGGMLVIADTRQAYRLLDGEYLIFDNRCWHGMTPFDCDADGYRVSLTLYLPTGSS